MATTRLGWRLFKVFYSSALCLITLNISLFRSSDPAHIGIYGDWRSILVARGRGIGTWLMEPGLTAEMTGQPIGLVASARSMSFTRW